MAESEQDAWYFSRDGQQSGPLRFEEIREKASQGLLRPRTDLLWREGMPDWKPIGEVEGLFERRPIPVEIVENPYVPPQETAAGSLATHTDWPGIRRFGYFFFTILLPIGVGLGLGVVLSTDQVEVASRQPDAAATTEFAGPALPYLIGQLIYLLVVIWVGLQRLANLGMSRWWYLGNLIPILNLWVGYRCFACPPGYAYHKKLDGLGIALAIFYWLLVGLGIVLILIMLLGFANSFTNATIFRS